MSVTPYGNGQNKKEEVKQMFDAIAGSYDFLNHVLSLNIDKIWRRRLIKLLGRSSPKTILDVATGTGDLALAALRINPEIIKGVDIATGMLEIGRKKILSRGEESRITLVEGDSENLPFEDQEFDAVMVAFGVRNFENPLKGLKEMSRVISPGGVVAILEFTMPLHFPVRPLYKFYFKRILPLIGKVISKDFSAYRYLPESVEAFAQREVFLNLMKDAGFESVHYRIQSFGIAAIYIGNRPL